MVYLDYNATTPLDKDVLNAISTSLQNAWGNPSSKHSAGVAAKKVIEMARQNVADMIGACSNDIIFTSGGTEANHMVIHNCVTKFEIRNKEKDENLLPHIITTNIEHDSVLLPLKHLRNKKRIELTIINVSKHLGSIDLVDISNSLKNNTCLISLMLANNETGIIQTVRKIALYMKKFNEDRLKKNLPLIEVHTDAAQAIGKIEVDIPDLCVDYLTIVGHKFYGPRIGALYVKDLDSKTNKFYPVFFGGGQEKGFRPGTENVGMIAGLGKAAELVTENLESYQKSMQTNRKYLETKLKETFGTDVVFNNYRGICGTTSLPNTCSVAFPFSTLTGAEILEKAGCIEASTGAACHGASSVSQVLLASGVEESVARHTLRLSIGRETTTQDLDTVIQALKNVLSQGRC